MNWKYLINVWRNLKRISPINNSFAFNIYIVKLLYRNEEP